MNQPLPKPRGLALTRRPGQSVAIGDDIRLIVLRPDDDQARVGVDGPDGTNVVHLHRPHQRTDKPLHMRRGEMLRIGDDVHVTVAQINDDRRVRVAIDAPANIKILRTELLDSHARAA